MCCGAALCSLRFSYILCVLPEGLFSSNSTSAPALLIVTAASLIVPELPKFKNGKISGSTALSHFICDGIPWLRSSRHRPGANSLFKPRHQCASRRMQRTNGSFTLLITSLPISVAVSGWLSIWACILVVISLGHLIVSSRLPTSC